MSLLVTSAGESQKNIKMVSDGILKMSVDTGTSTKQLGAGMYYIESAGFHAADALKVLGVAAMGAKTENADLATVARAVTGVMTDYHMKAGDAAQAMNGLIATVQNGKTNLHDLSASMGNVLPIASALGISFPQVAGAMDTMTNANMTARQASQNLAHVLLALSAPSGIAVKSMKSVGLSAQGVKDALDNQGLPQALQMIEDHVGKKFPASSVEYETALKNILGGQVGFKLAAMLTGKSLQETEANIAKVTAAMKDNSGAVMGWDVVQGNLNFQLDRAKEAFNVLLIVIGQKLLPIVTPLVKGFVDTLNAIISVISGTNTAGNAFGRFAPIVLSVKGVFILLWNILEGVGKVLSSIFAPAVAMAQRALSQLASGGLMSVLDGLNQFLVDVNNAVQDFADWFIKTNQAARALAVLGQALSSVINFFTKTEVGVAMLKGLLAGLAAAAIYFAVAAIPGIVAGFIAWATAAGAAAIATIAAAAPVLAIIAVVAAVVAVFILAYNHFVQVRQAVAALGQAAQNLWHGLQQLWSFLVSFFAPIFKTIGDVLQKQLAPVFQQLGQTLQSTLVPAWKTFQAALAELWKSLQPLAPVFQLLLPLLKMVGVLIVGTLVGALVLLAALLVGVVKGFAGLVAGLATTFKGIVEVVSGAIQIVAGVINFFVDLCTGKFNKLGGDLGQIWGGIATEFKGVWDVIVGIFQAVFGTIGGLFSGFVDTLVSLCQSLYNQLVGHSIIPDLVNGILDWFNKIPGFLLSLMQQVVSDLKTDWTNAYNAVKSIVTNIYNAIVAEFAKIKSAITSAWQAIGIIFSSAWSTYIVQPLTSLMTNITNWANTLTKSFQTWAANAMKGFGQSITQNLASVTTPIAGVGTAIANLLGFHSPPPQGPLAQSHTWMPNMMTLFGQGVANNTTKVTTPVNNMALQVGLSMNNLNNNVNTNSRLINLNLATIGTTAQRTNQQTGQSLNQMTASAQNAANGVKNSTNQINTSIQTVNTNIQSINQVAPQAFQNISQSSQQAASDVGKSSDDISKSAQTITTSAQSINQIAPPAFQNVSRSSQQAAQDVAKSGNDMQNSAKDTANGVKSYMVTVGGSASDAADKFKTASNDMQHAARDTDKMVQDIFKGDIAKALDDFQKQLTEKGAAIVAQAQGIASQVAALLGHSKPSLGPLKDDDTWGKHFVENIVGGMKDGMPGLTSMTNTLASTLAGGLASPLAGKLSVSGSLASPTIQSSQPMIIYNTIDGKIISKIVTNYQAGELRSQGGLRR